MKLVRTGALVLLFCALNWVLGFAAPPPGKEWSVEGRYQYNESLSEKYNADIYGNEHGKFTVMEGGSFTQNGKKGEYQYLGYTYEEWEFTNDNWFGKSGSKGKVFDSGYTGINWLPSDEAPKSWGKVEEHPNCEQLTKYIITAKFYDSDHVTAGETSTGLCLQKLLGSDINYIKQIAVLLNAPTNGQFGYIKLRYEKDGKQDYTTVIIKPFPYIECNMTATVEPISIPMGETRDVTVRIDTGDSFWCLEGEKYYTFTKREFWAGTGEVREIEKVESTNAVIEFTVKDVKPGTTINVWSKVYSEELKALDYDYEAEAVTSIYIYETFPPQPDAYDLDYNILSRTVRYPLSDTELTATLKLPRGSWYGNATGLLDVVNNTPDLLRNFMVENNPYVNEASSVIVRNPIIKTTFYRKDFGDDPEGRKWGNVPNPMVPLERYGSVSYHGSVERDYRYEYSCGGCQEDPETNELKCPGHVGIGTATAYFPSGTNGKTVRVFVYNGMPEVPKKRFTSSISGNIDTSPIKNLYWESEPYPLNVIRWMYHMDAYGNLYGGVPVDGRFQRTFTQQCSARIEYDVAKSMEAHYERSREAARQRNYNQSAYDKAVFATDVDLRNVDYPIKSGYYFNPCGEYEFVVETVTYKTTPDAGA